MLILNIDATKLQTQNIKPQLTVSQKNFLVENYFKAESISKVIRLFEECFRLLLAD